MRESYNWRTRPCIELFGCPEQSAVTTKGDDIVDLGLVFLVKGRVEFFCKTVESFVLESANLIKKVKWQNDVNADIKCVFLGFDPAQQDNQVFKHFIIPRLNENQDLGAARDIGKHFCCLPLESLMALR